MYTFYVILCLWFAMVCNILHLHVDFSVAGEAEPHGKLVVLGTLLSSFEDIVKEILVSPILLLLKVSLLTARRYSIS